MPRHQDRAAGGRRRASHSMESVLTEAVVLLDEAGPSALTFRALAQRLGGGVASIYWYVASKDELLDRATDHVIGGVLADIDAIEPGDDPIDDLRAISLALFDAILVRPWLGNYFMRNTDVQGNCLRLYEKLGQPTLRLKLTARQRFHAVSAISTVVVGSAVDLGQEPPAEVLDGAVGRDEFLSRFTATWRELDRDAYPFVHEIVDEFDGHDDIDQFRAALDLTLAESASRPAPERSARARVRRRGRVRRRASGPPHGPSVRVRSRATGVPCRSRPAARRYQPEERRAHPTGFAPRRETYSSVSSGHCARRPTADSTR
ncbi:hypothetical protein SCALM49S_03664 [Streptomyces californicus]